MSLLLLPRNRKLILPPAKKSIAEFKIPLNWRSFARMCKIRSTQGLQMFDPFEYQLKLIHTIHTTPYTVITKTRQLGFTEAVANYFLWKACLIPGYLGVIFSKSQGDTSDICRRVRMYIDSLGIETKTNALTDIELVGGGRIVFRNSTPDGSRSLSAVWDILFDEAGFVKEIEDIYQAAQPTTTVIGKKARIIILCTPAGQSGWYWDRLNVGNGDIDLIQICDLIKTQQIDPVQVWKDEDGAAKFICHWLAHPLFSKRKDTYLEETKRTFKLTENLLQQEYNLSFEHGEFLVFDHRLIKRCATGEWEAPKENELYYAGLDPSLEGDDYTVLTILRHDQETGKYRLVAMYRERKKQHPWYMYQIGKLLKAFGIYRMGIEVNGHGSIYHTTFVEEFLNVEFVKIKTSSSSKPVLVNRLLLAMESGYLEYPEEGYIINEFLSFRKEGGRLEAVSGQHDDIIMALACTIAVVPTNFAKVLESELQAA